MDDSATATLDDVIACNKSGEVLDTMRDDPSGHVLTVEHPGRDPQKDTLSNYLDMLHSVLGEPDDFDAYTVDIDSDQTVVQRADVPVCTFGSKADMQAKAASGLLAREKRVVFETAVENMDATVADVAEKADVHEAFVRRTLVSLDN